MCFVRPSSRRRIARALALVVLGAVGATLSAQQPQIVPGTNVNMVSGTTFPDGDPYLQRQNEPSSAVSTRNPLHILSGVNDYRTVDLPGPFDPLRGFKMNAEAWVGLFKSVDGGENWKSTLLPGFPQDVSADGLASPLKPRQAATDPVVRAGISGMFYYAGLAFDRGDDMPSAVFMARFMDLNNTETGDPFGYVDTRIVDSDSGARFLDKPALATDIPRGAAGCTITSVQTDPVTKARTTHVQTIPAGNVYVAYSAFTGHGADEQSVILFSRSTNCGQTWSTPKALSTGSRLVQNAQIAVSPTDGAVYVSWRRFRYLTQDDAIMIVKSVDGGATFGKVLRVSGVRPFDQITKTTQFRSNGFQTMAIDGIGRVYLAWPDRGYSLVRPDPVTGDSRIVLSTSANGSTWTVPRPIQAAGIGHQLMPAMTFHGGKLRVLYYDLREDVSGLFSDFIDEQPILDGAPPRIRHTLDAFVAQALPGSAPVFTTARVSDYARGFMPGSTIEERLQFNPPNLPMFRQGFVPFMGDYIDLAPAPPFVLNDAGAWVYNTAPSGSVVSHAFWTDNRDVRPPADGNWANYTPVTSEAVATVSRFDPTKTVPSCLPGQVGMRNQNVYTARVTDGLFVSAPGNNKQFNGFQRSFVIVAENASGLPRTYRLRIENQPFGGQASFLQFGPALTTLDVSVPALSSIARTVFVTAQDQNARISVSVTEVTGVGGTVVADGLTGTVVLNPDPQNPVLQNPVLQNPVLQNPVLQNISQGESYDPAISYAFVGVPNLQNPVLQNPNLQNPNLQNPSIQNPVLQNPNLQNPVLQNPVLQNDAVANPSIVNADLSNPNLQNPVLQNPNLQNPNLQNPNLQNAGFSDTNWFITNGGNTTASYTVNLLLNAPVPAGFETQLLVHKTFTTPAADGCELKEQLHTILLANIPNPQFITDPTNPNLQNPNLQNPNLQNPTLALAPGESATVTLRVLDPNIFDGVTYDASAAVTPAAVAQSVNTDDVAAGAVTPSVALPLTITTSEIPPVTPGAPINRTLQSVASTGSLVCSVISGQLPPGVNLSPTGTISGTPTTPGNYVFTVRCTDAAGKFDDQTLSIQVDPAAPVSFDVLWNGADSNWYNPANWSPHGVPTAAGRVYVSAATTVVPKLTANVTIRDLFLEPGATLDTNGFTLTVTNNADAGRTVTGDGRTVLAGNGGTASGVFSNLEIQGRITLTAPLTTTGTLTLAAGARLELNGQPLIVGGQLITNVTEGALPVIVGGANSPLLATGVNVNGLVLNGAPLTINAGALTRFDNVSFSGFAPDAVQLTVNNPGVVTHFPMNGLSFSNTPVTGLFVQANDTLDTGLALILDILGAVPADGTAFTGTGGGAIVNWLANAGEANLAVTQSVAPVPSAAGTRLNYTITVTNGGPAGAANVLLIPGVPVGATSVTTSATQGSCVSTSGGYRCALGNLPAGSAAVVTTSFVPATTGTLFTTASVSSDTPDAVIANNSHTVAATVLAAGQGVDLRLTKTDSLDPVSLNTPFSYTLTATNAGTTLATNLLVTDNVPAGIGITYATSASGLCSATSSQVVCSFASLAPGESVTMTFTAVGTSVGVVTNQASVTSAEPELTPGDNIATQVTAVVANASCSTATFAGPSILSANGGVFDVLSGDLNGDGAKDLVALVPSIDSVAVYLGDGTGGFGNAVFYPAGDGAIEGVLVDLNLDGRLDLALEGLTDAFVLLGNGNGGFAPPVQYTFPGVVSDVRTGDFNADGRPDLVVGVLDTNSIYILTGLASGGFAAPTPIPVQGPPYRIVVDDLNHDGRADLAITYFWSNLQGTPSDDSIAVLLADGNGGFSAPSRIPLQTANFSRVFALGDLNGDTHRDLGVVETTASGGRLFLLSGNGAGNFSIQQLTSAPASVNIVGSGDINGDGHLDLVWSRLNAQLLDVSLGDGAGAFAQPISFSAPFSTELRLSDLNGDGRLDVVVGMSQGGGVSVLLNGCGQAGADLAVAVTDAPDPGVEGGTVTHTSTVTNLGPAPAPGITLTQSFSANVGDIGPITPSQGSCSVAGRLMTCSLGTLAPGASLTVDASFTALGALSTVVGVGSLLPDPDPANNRGGASTTVTAAGRQIAVTNINDSGPGSLRQAILDSNSDAGDRDTVVFNIPGSGVRTITLLSALPQITQPVVIDGTSQPGYGGTPLIELNGNGLVAIGLNILAGSSEVRGLVINRFGGVGILLQAAGGNVIEGNYIGTDPTGTLKQANSAHGILVLTSGNRIGGSTAAARNVISGNGGSGIKLETGAATGNQIQGNYIGVNAGGVAAIGNTGSGVAFENGPAGNTIGGVSSAGTGNVISGNGGTGIALTGSNVTGNIVVGNRIGTDSFATTSIANGSNGVDIVGGQGNVIGGTTAGTGNVISGNAQSGISITGTSALIANNLVGTNGSGTSAIGNGANGVVLNAAAGNVIGVPGAGNVISGNVQNGIAIFGATSSGNQIAANKIGVNVLLTGAIGNLQDGIRIEGAASTVIGGTSLNGPNVEENFIGGNGQNGIGIYGSESGGPALGTRIAGNTIGFRAPPVTLGNNLSGIHIGFGNNAVIGGLTPERMNRISWNGRNGITVLSGIGNGIFRNSIVDNALLGIDLGNDGVSANDAGDGDTGPNDRLNFPVLSAVVGGVQGTLNSLPNTGYVIYYYSNSACDPSGNGEGETFFSLSSVTTDANGNAALPLVSVPPGTRITATTIGTHTSEFSNCVTVPAAPATADLSLTKSDSADPVPFGQAFNYVLVAQNAGPASALGVTVTDTLPTGLSIASAQTTQGSCTVVNQTVNCSLGTLPVNASATITINVTGVTAGTFTNTATISSELSDPVPGNNSDSEQTTIALASCSVATFTGPASYAGSPGPTDVVQLVDMNHDGKLDAVGTHERGDGDGGGVDVWLNDGTGHFAAPRFTSTVTGPWIHVVADFNGDTYPDVISATDRTAPGSQITLRLLTNDGTGTLTLSPTFSIPFGGFFRNIDLDRDGDQDLVIVTPGDELAVLRNDGQGNFGAPETILAGPFSFYTFGDFNGDNRTDLAVALGTPGFAVLLANPAGGFLPPVVHAVAGGAFSTADPVDLNADGRLDLLITSGDIDSPTPGTKVAFGDGAGGFGDAVPATDDFIYFPILTDLNGDGRRDLVGVSSLGSFGVWLGNGGASFAPPVHFPNAINYWPTVGDLNGDGRPDIAIGDINGNLNVFLNNCGAAPANLKVALTESADPVSEGNELVYTVTVTNQTAIPASGVRLTSVLAAETGDDPKLPNVAVAGIASSGGGTLTTSGFTYTWTVPTLAANDSITFTFRFRPLTGGTLLFTAGVSSDGADTDPSDNGAFETTTVTAVGRTLVVTNTNDSGPGSLRQAIEESNGDSGDRDTITFNIPGAAVPTITLQSGLPLIFEPVIIDATTQPAVAHVELNGNGLQASGLVIRGGNSIVRGMVLNRFGFDAMSLEVNGGNVVEGNFIGTDSTGTVARANGSGGIRVSSSGNRIGGLTAAARNVISGNSVAGIAIQGATVTGNVVQGNYIGLNAAGTAAVPNSAFGGTISIFNGASNNTIGGTAPGAGNVISGNTFAGISVTAATSVDNVIQGNFIGTDWTGAVRIANGGVGVDVVGAVRTIVGGSGLARNVISGNTTGIQIRSNASATRIQNNYIGLNAAGSGAIFNGTGISINSNVGVNTIGGTGTGEGNVISGNNGNGILIQNGSNGTIIQGNLIGLDAGGTLDLGNTIDGINLNGVSGTTIGGSTSGARNVISGNNTVGIRISGASATGNLVKGNYIGVNAAGTAAVGNGVGGISIQTGATGNTIGGAAAGEGNLISGNLGTGIIVASSNSTVIQGNLIGVNAAGTQALGNNPEGIRLSSVSGTIIGGTAAGAGNVLSGNGAYGINNQAGSTGTIVYGNRIGTNAAGTGPVPNGLSGMFVDGNGTTIGGTAAGAANIIAFNGTIGVNVAGGTGHAIVGNSIFSNGELGINLGPFGVATNDPGDGDAGENNNQNYPVLAAVAGGVQGTFNSTPNGTFTIHYYGNTACDPSGNGEGQTFLGGVSVGTDSNGNVQLPLFSAAAGLIVTATATSATGDTSEFSSCVTVPATAPSADLFLEMTESADPVAFGTPYSYSLLVHNNGPAAATNVQVTNTAEAGISIGSAVPTQGTCSVQSQTVTCALGGLGAGASATITLNVRGLIASVVHNSAFVTATEVDPVAENNAASAETTVTLASCTVPTFSAPVPVAVPTYDGIFSDQADLNGDGVNDLVVSMLAGGLAVRLNTGSGGFGPAIAIGHPAPLTFDIAPRSFALGDLNGDGKIDIAVATGSAMEVLIGAGNGSFSTPVPYALGALEPLSAQVIDLDKDGDLDVVLDSLDDNDQRIQVFRNTGGGVFAPVQLVTMAAVQPAFPVIGDFNGDGFPDFAAGSWQHVLSIVLADGNGGYLAPIAYNPGPSPVVAGDVTADGKVDLIVEGDGAADFRIWIGDGTGHFTPGAYLGQGATAVGTRLVDINRDGLRDLVVAHPSLGTVAVQLGQAGGTFAAPIHYASPFQFNPATIFDDGDDISGGPSVGDLNGDGQLDIAYANPSGFINILFSTCGQPAADLSVTAQDAADPVAEGAAANYVVTVTNHGPAMASGVTVNLAVGGVFEPNHPALAHFTVVTGAACTWTDQTASCTLANLASGQSVNLQATVATGSGSTITLTASAASNNADPTPGDNTDFETTVVSASGRNLVVTNTNDSGAGSLRQAIIESNSDSGDRDTIVFNIPGAGVHSITLNDDLPQISQPVVIDGKTQPGAGATPVIEVNGNNLPGTGFPISAGNSIVRGLAINRFSGGAIALFTGGGNALEGNFIGTNPAGTAPAPNNAFGILVQSPNNRIDGTTAAGRNVISGNQGTGIIFNGVTANNNVVLGNYIGLDAAGAAPLANTQGIVLNGGAGGNTIGGSGAGNVISGNGGNGINIQVGSNGNIVRGNTIGLNAAGAAAVANTQNGISLNGASSTTIGGTAAGAGNIIAGNTGNGIIAGNGTASTVIQGNRIGTNASGTASLPNLGHGVSLSGTNTTVGGSAAGAANIIANNGMTGVRLSAGTGHAILGNSIFGNISLGIDLSVAGVTPNDAGDTDGGPNNNQNFPVLSAAAGGVQGTLNSTANTTFTIQYFGNTACDSSGNGEGETFLGQVSVTTNGSGNATLPLFSASSGQVVTATATNATTNDTSEFSACVTVLGPATFTVTNTNDSGAGSLRQAILNSNASAGQRDTIAFDIPGSGPYSIVLLTSLPTVTDPVIIDGLTQPGAGGIPVIELNGNGLGANGLTITAGGSTVRGLVINRFTGAGILLSVGDGNVIERNYIGVDSTGTADLGNGQHGIDVRSGQNVIGGTTAAARNVISGNNSTGILISGATASANVVQGNYIGTNAAGTARLGNTADGILIFSSGNTIGGTVPGAGNVLAANGFSGLWINSGANNIVQGNFVGTNGAGATGLGNLSTGVLANGSGNTIGGSTAGAGNVIVRNGGEGLRIAGPASTGNVVQGNYIGTDASGAAGLGNTGPGVWIFNGAANNTIGGSSAGNVISGNTGAGVQITDNGTGNAVRFNSIHSNAGLGIDLGTAGVTPNDTGDGDSGANNLQNFPVLTAVAGGVQGTLNSTSNTAFNIHFYGNAGCDPSGSGEGQTLLGSASVTTDGAGNAAIPLFGAAAGTIVTATATSAANNTSEFSACVTVALGPRTFTVTNTNDSGAGSLRQAILDANALVGTFDTISFNIPGQGPFRIAPTSPLPTITDRLKIDGTTAPQFVGQPIVEIEGTSAGAAANGLSTAADGCEIRGLVINRFGTGGTPGGAGGTGILLQSSNNVVEGSFIGTDLTGFQALANREDGIRVDHAGNRIGGTTLAARNVISANGRNGVLIEGAGATGNLVVGNWIGVGAGGAGLPNAVDGVHVNAAGTTIGGTSSEGNYISGNGRAGVYLDASATATNVQGNTVINNLWGVQVVGSQNLIGGIGGTLGNTITSNISGGVMVLSGTGNRILGNSIFGTVTGLGIDLGLAGVTANDPGDVDSGANTLQNFPVLTAGPVGVDGTLNSTPTATFRIEYFGSEACSSSGNGEGEVFLGAVSVTTDANGNATLPFFSTGSGQAVTATATSSSTNNTSEFSACVEPEQVTRTWISSAGGNWEDPTKWSGGIVPQSGEDVFIDGNFTVSVSSATVSLTSISATAHVQMSGGTLTVSSNASFVGGLTMTGGTLDGRGSVFLDGVSSWTGGEMTGSGLTFVLDTGTLTVSSATPGSLTRSIGNLGRLVWNQPSLTMQNAGIVNQGTLEIQNNLPISGGFLNNQGLLLKTGSPGALSLSGTSFTNTGQIQLRLGQTNDTIVSNGHVQLDGGSLELVLQSGFDPAEGAAFDVIEWVTHAGTFPNVFGTGRLYDATYGSTLLTVTARHGVVTPLAFDGFSATAHIETFAPNFGRQTPPVTFNGLTYSSPGGQLISDTNWDGFYASWPTASEGFGLNDVVGLTDLQIDFSTPVRKVGLLAVAGQKSTFLMKAYDDNLTLIGITSATMPGDNDAAFLGLQSTVNIRRIVLTEPYDNQAFTIVDDIRWEGPPDESPGVSVAPNPATAAETIVGESRDIDIVVTSTGGGLVTVTPSVTPGAFTLPLLPIVCVGGGSAASAGSPCVVRVRFSPTAVGPTTGTLTLNTSGGQFLVALSGTGLSPLAVAPPTLAFPDTNVGQISAAQAITLTNNSNLAQSIAISSIATSANFQRTTNCGATLVAHQSCSVSVTFSPTAVGQLAGTVTISSNAAGSPHTVSASGRGMGGFLSLTPPSLTFVNQVVGTSSAAQNVSVQNTGNLPVTLTAVTVSGDFNIATSSCAGTLDVSASCVVGVSFAPTTTGTRNGSLTIQSSALGSPSTASLTGVGVTGNDSTVGSLSFFNPAPLGPPNPSAQKASATGALTFFNPAPLGPPNPPAQNASATAALTFFNPAPLGPPNPPAQNASATAALTFFNPAPLGPPNAPAQNASATGVLTFFNPAPLGPPNPPAQTTSVTGVLSFSNGSSANTTSETQVKPNGRRIR